MNKEPCIPGIFSEPWPKDVEILTTERPVKADRPHGDGHGDHLDAPWRGNGYVGGYRAAVPQNNGFQSFDRMTKAHDGLLSVLPVLPSNALVFDPGCGDGTLLQRISAHGIVTTGVPYRVIGIEADLQRVAASVLPFGAIRHGAISDFSIWPGQAEIDLTLFFPGRILEYDDPAVREAIRFTLVRRSRRILFYDYNAGLAERLLAANLPAGQIMDHGGIVQTFLLETSRG